MNLLQKIDEDLIKSLKSRDAKRVGVLRLLKNALLTAKIDLGELTPDKEIKIVQKQAKDRREAILLYQQNNNPEAVSKEQEELDIISEYLPEQMSDEEITKIVEQALDGDSSDSLGDKIKKVMPEIAGKADSSRVIEIIKKLS